MKLLLDTHALIWVLAGDRRLSRRAGRAFAVYLPWRGDAIPWEVSP